MKHALKIFLIYNYITSFRIPHQIALHLNVCLSYIIVFGRWFELNKLK